MSTIKIITPGKIRETWLQQGIDEFVRRLSRYTRIQFLLVDDVPDSWPFEKALQEEAKRLLGRIRPQDFVIVLDLAGIQLDSVELSRHLQDWLRDGGSEVAFVIGGSNGLAPEVLARANFRLWLSKMTYTHLMTRLILLEQCYRAFRIERNEPYHK